MIVAIETATDVVGVALAKPDGELLAHIEVRGSRRHAETLVPAIEFLCRQVQRPLADVTCVAVDAGPGLFTGLRVGLATAKGLAYAHGVPIVAVGSLEALASAHARPGERVAAVIDARRGELYAAVYEGGRAVVEPWVGAPEAVAAQCVSAAFVVGDGPYRHPAPFAGQRTILSRPSVVTVAALAAGRVGIDAGMAAVTYLRAPDAEINWVTR